MLEARSNEGRVEVFDCLFRGGMVLGALRCKPSGRSLSTESSQSVRSDCCLSNAQGLAECWARVGPVQQYRNGEALDELRADVHLGQTVLAEAVGSVDGAQL